MCCIDKLRLGFDAPADLFDKISNNIGETLYFDGFLLDVERQKIKADCEPTKIAANCYMGKTYLGEFIFNSTSGKYDGMCFFKFANKALYQSFTSTQDKCNHIPLLPYIADSLNLCWKSSTEIEVALDIDRNIINPVRRYIKNCKDFEMIYNGKRVEEHDRRLENYSVSFGGSRIALDKYPTVYLCCKNEEIRCKIYDKKTEIETSSGKEYIKSWHQFNGDSDSLFRIEFTIKWPAIYQDFFQYLNTLNVPTEWKNCFTYTDERGTYKCNICNAEYLPMFLNLLTDQDFLAIIWSWAAEKIVYFRNIKTGKKKTLLDIAIGGKSLKRAKNGQKQGALILPEVNTLSEAAEIAS